LPEFEELRVYIRYEALRAREFRGVLEGLERAYDQLDHLFTDTRSVRPRNRLTISSVHTGKSVETILSGSAQAILLIGFAIHFLQKEALVYWQSRKTKWESKIAEKKFHEMEDHEEKEQRLETALREKDRRLTKALESLSKVTKQIDRSHCIVSVEIQIVSEETEMIDLRPKRAIRLED
jgi:hypothetical protein